MKNLRAIIANTPDGIFYFIIDEHDIVRVSGFGSLNDLAKRLPEELRFMEIGEETTHPYQKKLAAYYNGDTTALDAIPRAQDGSPFQEKVWQVISDIQYGETMSYKQLAAKSGSPTAIRAVGTICGLNRLILLVPCHRVLKSNGDTGNYLYGSVIKESLLHRESLNR